MPKNFAKKKSLELNIILNTNKKNYVSQFTKIWQFENNILIYMVL